MASRWNTPKPLWLSDKVKFGSILDRNDFISYTTNQALAQKIIKAFEDCRLMHFMCHDHSSTHRTEDFECYLSARENNNSIVSRVVEVDIFIPTEDIRSVYGLPLLQQQTFSSYFQLARVLRRDQKTQQDWILEIL